eukprot:1161821-Pelagomonas_calceolata.AAC.8
MPLTDTLPQTHRTRSNQGTFLHHDCSHLASPEIAYAMLHLSLKIAPCTVVLGNVNHSALALAVLWPLTRGQVTCSTCPSRQHHRLMRFRVTCCRAEAM